ncbi:MAG: winged helix-turn-helix domain-containing protein [Phycisphaerales bacterium]
MFSSKRLPIPIPRVSRGRSGKRHSLRVKLGYPTENDLAIALLRVLESRGGWINFSVYGDDLECSLADQFNLSQAARDYSDSTRFRSKGARAWRNHIQWARKRLVDLGLLDRSIHGVWCLTERGRAIACGSHKDSVNLEE